jgi:hypothetical protein
MVAVFDINNPRPCPYCSWVPPNLRPTGTQTFTVNGLIHVTSECAQWDFGGRMGNPPFKQDA